MNDQFRSVRNVGIGSRLVESIKGVLVGILFFLGSFPLLFWNEGRAVRRAKDLEEGRGAVVAVAAETVDPARTIPKARRPAAPTLHREAGTNCCDPHSTSTGL